MSRPFLVCLLLMIPGLLSDMELGAECVEGAGDTIDGVAIETPMLGAAGLDLEGVSLIQRSAKIVSLRDHKRSKVTTPSNAFSENPQIPSGMLVVSQKDRASAQDVLVALGVCVMLFIVYSVVSKCGSCITIVAVSPYVAEFVGTYALAFTIGFVLITGNNLWSALVIASVLMVMIYSTAAVSGGNLNPAVSWALLLAGKADMTWSKMLAYWAAQVLAGICAGYSYSALLSHKVAHVSPAPGFALWHAGLVEVIYSFVLVFVVLNIATVEEKAGNWYYALSIGFTVVAGGYAAGNVSGAAFNPAVVLGFHFSSHNQSVGYGFAWAVFQLLGGTLAALIFKVVRKRDERDQPTTVAKLTSEFVGTCVLVLTVGLNLITNNLGPTALSAAASLMAMTYALGDVSGAHLNPAVTLACCLRGATAARTAASYVIFQLVAGILSGLLSAVFHVSSAQGVPALVTGLGYSPLQGGIVELVFTTILAYTVLSTATCKKVNQNFGLAIGFCVIAGGFAGRAVSGGELNPAVCVGIASASHMLGRTPSVTMLLLFILWELAGGILAALIFRVTHQAEFARDEK